MTLKHLTNMKEEDVTDFVSTCDYKIVVGEVQSLDYFVTEELKKMGLVGLYFIEDEDDTFELA